MYSVTYLDSHLIQISLIEDSCLILFTYFLMQLVCVVLDIDALMNAPI